MSDQDDIRDKIQNIWWEQQRFNRRIRFKNAQTDSFWTKQYLLGLVSEVDEVLREVNWKEHRANKNDINRTNLAFELADITKYVLSLWELWGFSLQEMLDITLEKSWWVRDRCDMELAPDPVNSKVLITDLDGTLADWRQSFIIWMQNEHGVKMPQDTSQTLLLDQDLAWKYPEYVVWKDEFESKGGYANLVPYADGIDTVRYLQREGVYVIVYTARPEHQYKRIWWDTLQWLNRQAIYPDKLLIGAEPRILLAHTLQKKNDVILFDDDPNIIIRAANAGVRIYARRHPYNKGISHENITWVNQYDENAQYFGKGDRNV